MFHILTGLVKVELKISWSDKLRSVFSRRVDAALDSALAGERVGKNTTLIIIEKSQYQVEIAATELVVKAPWPTRPCTT